MHLGSRGQAQPCEACSRTRRTRAVMAAGACRDRGPCRGTPGLGSIPVQLVHALRLGIGSLDRLRNKGVGWGVTGGSCHRVQSRRLSL